MAVVETSPWLTWEPAVRRFPPLAGDTTADVAVVGGGIAGVSAAYFLARRGRRVVLLESNQLGSGETGYTTAFLTSSVDVPFAVLRQPFGDSHVRQLRALGEEAMTAVERLVAEERLDCGFRRVDAFMLGLPAESADVLNREADALRAAGGEPILLDADNIVAHTSIRAASALRIPRQAEFHVRAYLLGLADRVRARGGRIFEETRLTKLDTEADGLAVRTSGGTVRADQVVFATGLFPPPFAAVNHSFHQLVTYVLALNLGDHDLPTALYWDAAEPFHYLRFVDELLFLGGEDRPLRDATKVGRAPWAALAQFAERLLPRLTRSVTHAWRGQILATPDALPLAGTLPGGDPRILFLSGFGGNGMTLATVGARAVADLLTGGLPPQENPFRLDRPTLTTHS